MADQISILNNPYQVDWAAYVQETHWPVFLPSSDQPTPDPFTPPELFFSPIAGASGVQAAVFKQFKQNPEHFIAESSRLINEQKATMIIERLSYDSIAETHDIDIFTAGQSKQDFSRASEKLKKHVYDYVIFDSNSKIEREFVQELDTGDEVIVYAKLPRGFTIPTPVGNYNPDWAISFKDGSVKHIYFVAETKGSMSTMQLRAIEEKKIECARKFFAEINRRIDHERVKYDVVNSYGELMKIISMGESA